MKFVFIMCPLDDVKVAKDTSYALMLGAARRGHEVYHVRDNALSLAGSEVVFSASSVAPSEDPDKPFTVHGETKLAGSEADAVFIRTDPPFDQNYLLTTWLLDKLPPQVAVINSAKGVRAANEKIWAAQFTEFVPPTLVTRDKGEYISFLEKHKEAVLKPTNGYGGQSVFRVRYGEPNMHVVFETLSGKAHEHVIAQKYIVQAEKGDKRILLLDGEPLGAVLRVHAPDDHRNNFFAGGQPHPVEITARDEKIIKALAPSLKDLGLYFVGIDIIGEYLIEVNVTSPTCLQEMNRLYHKRLEDDVIAFAERLVKKQVGQLSGQQDNRQQVNRLT